MVTWCPTKPQSQSSAGYAKSYRTNIDTTLADTTNIVKFCALSFLGHVGKAQLWGRRSLLLCYSQWLSDQGQSSRTVVTWCPTKPQSQSSTGFTKSYRTNINTTLTNTTNIVKISRSPLSQSRWEGTALRKTFPPFVLQSMTERSGPEFTYRGNVASNQATKPK
jgi:hypothetical protein